MGEGIPIPNPGSPEAVVMGCKCPRMDNGHGKGCGKSKADGSPLFWRDANCPMHGWPEEPRLRAPNNDHEQDGAKEGGA